MNIKTNILKPAMYIGIYLLYTIVYRFMTFRQQFTYIIYIISC